jgi:hypothetical protein
MIEVTELLEPIVESKYQEEREEDRRPRKRKAELVHQLEQLAIQALPFELLTGAFRKVARQLPRVDSFGRFHGFIVPQA